MRAVRTAAVVLAATAVLGTGTALALLSVPAEPAATTATAAALRQVTGVTAAGLGTVTVRWGAEGSGLTTGYRVARYPTATGGTATVVCTTSAATLTCNDPAAPVTGAFYAVTALLTPSGATVPAWLGPESARAGTGPSVLPAPSVPDLEAASDSGASGTDDVTNATAPVFAGTGTPMATVSLLSGGQVVGTAQAGLTGTWRVTATLAEGLRTVTATQALAGSSSPASGPRTVTVDRTAPLVTIGNVDPKGNSGNGALSGTAGQLAGDGTTIGIVFRQGTTVVGSFSTTSSGGFWGYDYALSRGGTFSLTVSQVDLAGNAGSVTRSVTT